jgi:hypothetical protein
MASLVVDCQMPQKTPEVECTSHARTDRYDAHARACINQDDALVQIEMALRTLVRLTLAQVERGVLET